MWFRPAYDAFEEALFPPELFSRGPEIAHFVLSSPVSAFVIDETEGKADVRPTVADWNSVRGAFHAAGSFGAPYVPVLPKYQLLHYVRRLSLGGRARRIREQARRARELHVVVRGVTIRWPWRTWEPPASWGRSAASTILGWIAETRHAFDSFRAKCIAKTRVDTAETSPQITIEKTPIEPMAPCMTLAVA